MPTRHLIAVLIAVVMSLGVVPPDDAEPDLMPVRGAALLPQPSDCVCQ
jgi:hypothetical protein